MEEVDVHETALPLNEMVEQALHRHGDGQAIRFNGVWYGWNWVRRVAERIIALLDEAGVREDEAVAIAPATEPTSAAALVGLIMHSREIVMMYAYQSPAALARKAKEVNCAAIIALDSMWERPMVEAAQEIGAVGIAISLEAQNFVPGTAVDRSVEHRLASVERGINLLSSGTTGPPKLRSLDYACVRRGMVLESLVQKYGGEPASHPAAHYAAFGNIGGLYSWLPFVVSGRRVVMLEKFKLDEYLAYLAEFRPPSGGMPPPAWRELMERDLPVEVLQGMKFMGGGASLFDPDLQRAVEEKFGLTILQSYGATEFGGSITATTPEDIAKFGREKSKSVGRALAQTGAEFRIVDPESGKVLAPNTIGLLHVKVPRIGPDWIPTSDLGKLDEDGFLYYVGRNDAIISRGGFKIDPEQVKAALLTHPAIYDAMVVGKADARLGELPVAAIAIRSTHEAPDADDLKAYLRDRLPATFIPAAFKALAAIPVTATNKPDLAGVKSMFAD